MKLCAFVFIAAAVNLCQNKSADESVEMRALADNLALTYSWPEGEILDPVATKEQLTILNQSAADPSETVDDLEVSIPDDELLEYEAEIEGADLVRRPAAVPGVVTLKAKERLLVTVKVGSCFETHDFSVGLERSRNGGFTAAETTVNVNIRNTHGDPPPDETEFDQEWELLLGGSSDLNNASSLPSNQIAMSTSNGVTVVDPETGDIGWELDISSGVSEAGVTSTPDGLFNFGVAERTDGSGALYILDALTFGLYANEGLNPLVFTGPGPGLVPPVVGPDGNIFTARSEALPGLIMQLGVLAGSQPLTFGVKAGIGVPNAVRAGGKIPLSIAVDAKARDVFAIFGDEDETMDTSFLCRDLDESNPAAIFTLYDSPPDPASVIVISGDHLAFLSKSAGKIHFFGRDTDNRLLELVRTVEIADPLFNLAAAPDVGDGRDLFYAGGQQRVYEIVLEQNHEASTLERRLPPENAPYDVITAFLRDGRRTVGVGSSETDTFLVRISQEGE